MNANTSKYAPFLVGVYTKRLSKKSQVELENIAENRVANINRRVAALYLLRDYAFDHYSDAYNAYITAQIIATKSDRDEVIDAAQDTCDRLFDVYHDMKDRRAISISSCYPRGSMIGV